VSEDRNLVRKFGRWCVWALAAGCVVFILMFRFVDAWPIGHFAVRVEWSSKAPSPHNHDLLQRGAVQVGKPQQ